MKKLICSALMGFCFLWILGAAGSLELDRISMTEFIARGVPALAVLYVSFWIGGFKNELL